jgi:hypothetical protein
LSRDEFLLLAKAFKEASTFTNESDDFNTMTGHDWDEALELQQELDEIANRLLAQ